MIFRFVDKDQQHNEIHVIPDLSNNILHKKKSWHLACKINFRRFRNFQKRSKWRTLDIVAKGTWLIIPNIWAQLFNTHLDFLEWLHAHDFAHAQVCWMSSIAVCFSWTSAGMNFRRLKNSYLNQLRKIVNFLFGGIFLLQFPSEIIDWLALVCSYR